MPGLSSDDCFDRLRPYHPRLLKCFRNAWRKWQRDHAPKLPGIRLSAMRTLVQELIVMEVRAEFAEDSRIEIIETSQHHFLLAIPPSAAYPRILIRFKHLDDNKRTANLRTPGSLDYDFHRPIDLVPVGLRLNAGYRADETESELQDVLITRSHGPRILWDYALWARGADVSSMRPAQGNLQGTDRHSSRVPSRPSSRRSSRTRVKDSAKPKRKKKTENKKEE